MRKRVVGLLPSDSTENHSPWLDLSRLAQVEVTSEEINHPVESAFDFGESSEWRAASPGNQMIRLIFDQPQAIKRICLRFDEAELARTQEFTLRWSRDRTSGSQEIVRQQWNFSPEGSTSESEDYLVDLVGASVLELTIDPDLGAGEATAKLTSWRVA
jgi:hypothetical protein